VGEYREAALAYSNSVAAYADSSDSQRVEKSRLKCEAARRALERHKNEHRCGQRAI
jgi:hypothetical protein